MPWSMGKNNSVPLAGPYSYSIRYSRARLPGESARSSIVGRRTLVNIVQPPFEDGLISTAVGPRLRRARRKEHVASKLRGVELFDITVIGGGPTGLFALFYAGMRGAKAKVIDALPAFGGQLYALYPEKYVYDMPGYPAIIAQDLVNACVEQAMQWPHAVCLEERVTNLERRDDGTFKLTTDKTEHLTKTVLISSGIGAIKPRKLPAP